jgi:hypothetical protein
MDEVLERALDRPITRPETPAAPESREHGEGPAAITH